MLNQLSKDGRRLVYLDSAATAQKPQPVLDAVRDYYNHDNANPHRGAYALSVRATERYEQARADVLRFVNAIKYYEAVFTKSATEAFNLIAYSYGMHFIEEGDEIVLTIAEHHSNLVPWQQVAKVKGAKLVYLYVDENGNIPKAELEQKITKNTKLLAMTQVSNVLGTRFPSAEMIARAQRFGAVTVLDSSQAVPHMRLDLEELQADFAVFAGHKMYAPMGIGVLCAKRELLNRMPPFLFGGDMIEYVKEQSATFAPAPQRFEGGTQNVEAAVGLSAAIGYLEAVSYDTIQKIEEPLTAYALERLGALSDLTLFGSRKPEGRSGVISFNVNGAHPHDVASILDASGVAVRSGHHCAQPLFRYLGVNASCRMSLGLYNTKEDIDRLIEGLAEVRRLLKLA